MNPGDKVRVNSGYYEGLVARIQEEDAEGNYLLDIPLFTAFAEEEMDKI